MRVPIIDACGHADENNGGRASDQSSPRPPVLIALLMAATTLYSGHRTDGVHSTFGPPAQYAK